MITLLSNWLPSRSGRLSLTRPRMVNDQLPAPRDYAIAIDQEQLTRRAPIFKARRETILLRLFLFFHTSSSSTILHLPYFICPSVVVALSPLPSLVTSPGALSD